MPFVVHRLSFNLLSASLAFLAVWIFVPSADTLSLKELPKTAPRPAWTGSKVTGSPEPPPPYKIVHAFPNLKFDHPLLMARAPGSDRLYVGEEAGVLYSFAAKPDAKAELFFDLRKEIKTVNLLPNADRVEKVYGLVFHPQFEKNRQCFVCYTIQGNDKKRNFPDGTRISRFTVTKAEPPRIDPASEEIVISFLQGGHNGGDLHFGNDGMLYISTGDATNPNPPDEYNTGQDISDLLSSVLRIDVDRKDEGKNYAVPKDNPFVGMKDARPEVWAYGFRNPWRMSFDRKTGELFLGDVGWELFEMIHRVEKGGNHGWSATEGGQPIKPEKVGPTPIRRALIDLPHSIACSVTGGYVYRGKKFPDLEGAYIFGDWETRRIWSARFEGDRTKEMIEITKPLVRVVAFGEDKDGELYFLDYDTGTVHTLERNDASAKNANFPTKLSETGLFASVPKHVPAAGVVPFHVNARQWQDGATAEHFAAFPASSSATLYATGKPIPGNVDWRKFRFHFPKDAVLQRTLSLGERRVETQLLHFDGVDWRPYTFMWRDDQSDADIVPADGAEKEIYVGQTKRVWQFHSRSQCMSCHHSLVEYALAFQPDQLNRALPDGRHQLVALSEMGLIRRVDKDGKLLPSFDTVSADREPKLVDPFDAGKPLETRARAYLHANCGHCHRDHGGGIVNLRLHASAKPADMKAIDVVPSRGDFGLREARIIKPGDPCSSTLFYRMAKFGKDRMPHVGSELLDEAGLKLIEQWIAEMKPGKAALSDLSSVEKILASTRPALIVARKLGQGDIKQPDREKLLAAAAKLPAGPVRDLFEGYLSQDGKPRKLGSNPRPISILAMKGDAANGEKLFWSQALKCATCHKLGERGTPIGPDLTAIGRQRAREDLLESLLEPSRRIESNFAAFTARTLDGKSLTGIVAKRDGKQIELRDAENKIIAIASDDLEELRPARTSLMPDGQMAGLTAQEAADLLEYLATRR